MNDNILRCFIFRPSSAICFHVTKENFIEFAFVFQKTLQVIWATFLGKVALQTLPKVITSCSRSACISVCPAYVLFFSSLIFILKVKLFEFYFNLRISRKWYVIGKHYYCGQEGSRLFAIE